MGRAFWQCIFAITYDRGENPVYRSDPGHDPGLGAGRLRAACGGQQDDGTQTRPSAPPAGKSWPVKTFTDPCKTWMTCGSSWGTTSCEAGTLSPALRHAATPGPYPRPLDNPQYDPVLRRFINQWVPEEEASTWRPAAERLVATLSAISNSTSRPRRRSAATASYGPRFLDQVRQRGVDEALIVDLVPLLAQGSTPRPPSASSATTKPTRPPPPSPRVGSRETRRHVPPLHRAEPDGV